MQRFYVFVMLISILSLSLEELLPYLLLGHELPPLLFGKAVVVDARARGSASQLPRLGGGGRAGRSRQPSVPHIGFLVGWIQINPLACGPGRHSAWCWLCLPASQLEPRWTPGFQPSPAAPLAGWGWGTLSTAGGAAVSSFLRVLHTRL